MADGKHVRLLSFAELRTTTPQTAIRMVAVACCSRPALWADAPFLDRLPIAEDHDRTSTGVVLAGWHGRRPQRAQVAPLIPLERAAPRRSATTSLTLPSAIVAPAVARLLSLPVPTMVLLHVDCEGPSSFDVFLGIGLGLDVSLDLVTLSLAELRTTTPQTAIRMVAVACCLRPALWADAPFLGRLPIAEDVDCMCTGVVRAAWQGRRLLRARLRTGTAHALLGAQLRLRAAKAAGESSTTEGAVLASWSVAPASPVLGIGLGLDVSLGLVGEIEGEDR